MKSGFIFCFDKREEHKINYYEQSGGWGRSKKKRAGKSYGNAAYAVKSSPGFIWNWQPVDLLIEFKAIICNSCGYSFCYSNKTFMHKKELKPIRQARNIDKECYICSFGW